ncbi:APC family permease [Leptolinea tardivitalis]|uniref:Amino acid permease n=1 Tax=Leptolinea tardivitalis TaxID=229920 RepID=A0A0P6X1D7_9CHLR|nr:APC family permease [Leptolinea tardivitalis]KPL73174.1 amino acid permease [Leptolinea tardivitalis]GAP21274.1 amino acid/polyamine/organocation transporter, APC superfamily [Leptolinea tardivitalis]
MSVQSAAPKTGFTKALKIFDMTLFTVCAIMVIDTLAASASIGASSITWWIITLILFFIPYGLITAELGSTYPEEGGIYVWIKHAFGEKWAARSTWYYWINVALWMPSVYILFAGMFAQLFFPDMSLWWQIAIGVIMTWITVWVDNLTLETGKWFPNIGAAFKVIIMLVLGIGGITLAIRNGVANDMSAQALLPTWDAGLAFLPVILYNFMGFELMSGAGDEMKNPKRDIPVAIITAGLLIAFFYLFSTTGILLALPIDQLGLISGIIDTLKAILGDTGFGGIMVVVLGIGALYTFMANMITWTMGANRTAAQAAEEGELPAVFGKLDPVNKTPVGANIITGIVSTLVIVLYGFMAGSAEDLFWTLFKFSSIIFFLPYLLLFPAFLKLRKKDASITRPYKMPGGDSLAAVLCVICELFVIQAIVFFLWVPGQELSPDTIPVLIGLFLTILVGEIILIACGKKKAA